MVNITVKRNNKELTDKNIVIYPDDTCFNIKDKLYRFYEEIELFPKFSTIKNKDYIYNDDELIMLKFDYTREYDLEIISVFDIINSKIEKQEIVNILYDEEYIETFIESLKEYNIDLKINDVRFILNTLIYSYTQDNTIVKISDIQDYYLEEIVVYNKNTKKNKNEIMDNIIKEDYDNYEELYEISNNNFDVVFNFLEFTYKPSFYISGVYGNYIDLNKLFNIIELNENIVMCVIEKEKRIPIVKIYNKFEDKNLIKNWMLNINKKIGKYTFKKFKGINLKYIFNNIICSISILRNGIINVKIESEIKYDDIEMIIENINKILIKINEYPIFKKSKKLEVIKKDKIKIELFSIFTCTKRLINLDSFKNILRKYDINKFFLLKDVISETVISIYYTLLGINDGERKGITINISNNNKKTNSSRIEIHSGLFINQITSILQKIYLINKIVEKNEGVTVHEESIIIEESNVKELRKKGGEILSTKCQKQRQPIIGGVPLKGSYKLDFKGQTYTCPKKEYPYPSVNKYNIVCCFKKDQKNKIDNENDKIIVQISNIQISENKFIILKDEELYFVDYNNKESLENNVIFKLSDKDISTFNDIKKDLEKNNINNIWSQPIPLQRLFKNTLKTICTKQPDFDKKGNMCSKYSKNNKFGFTKEGYPCCFNELNKDFSLNENEILKQHILKTDSVLENQRLGILPDILNQMFLKFSLNKNDEFIRMGILYSSFVYIIIFVLNFNFNLQISSHFDLLKYFENNLSQNDFDQLNNENIFKNFEEFLISLNNFEKIDNINKILSKYLVYIFKTNIIIFDIPFVKTKSNINYDYKNIKIDCTINNKNTNENAIFVIKKDNLYELIVYISENKITSVFDNKFIKLLTFFNNYINETCIKKIDLPETFMYNEFYTITELQKSLLGTSFEIKYQILNNFNKIVYIATKNKVLIPIQSIYKVNNLDILDLQQCEMDMYKIIKEYKNINTILKKRKKTKMLDIIGHSIENSMINGLMTNFGIMIPIKLTQVDKNIINDNKLLFNWNDSDIIKIDKYIKENTVINTPYDDYYNMILKIKRYIYDTKVKLGLLFSNNEELSKYIEEIIVDKIKSRYIKIKTIEEILKKLDEYLHYDKYIHEKNVINFILNTISIEIVNDTIEMNILNNNITLEYMDSYIVRDNEILITHIDELLNYIK